MERIKSLNRYQKGILLLLICMIVVFGVIYSMVSSRVGYLYNDVILLPSEEGGNTIYSGNILGQECAFTVASDKTVTFQCGEKIYGPYTAREDSTAKPKDQSHLTGVEILDGDEVFFRGGVWRSQDGLTLLDEDGGIMLGFTVYTEYGTTYNSDGTIFDPMEPSAATVLELMDGPELTSKGEWKAWFAAVVVSVLIAVSILFADELFRFNLSFQIQNVDHAEPSDWEIAGRYIGWTVLTIMTLVIYIIGLQ